MLGTFGLRPKGTMSARAAGLAESLVPLGVDSLIVTVPWDSPESAGERGYFNGIPYVNTRTVRPRLWPMAVREMVAEASRFQPHLVHLFKPKGFGDLTARCLHQSGLPVVVDMDDWEGDGGWNDVLPYSRAQRRLFDWQERTWPARADGVTVASEVLWHRARQFGAPLNAMLRVPNALSVDRFRELSPQPGAEKTGVTGQELNILVYTRFVEFSPSFLIKVLAQVVGRCPATTLTVAGGSGDGTAERTLEADAARAGLRDHLKLIGWQDPKHLAEVASTCHVGLVPFDDTNINRAKCSVKLLELLACGLPVVASNVGENRTYVRPGRNGLLARAGDAAGHASAIVDAYAARQFGMIDSEQIRHDARERFSWDRTARSVRQRYLGITPGS